MITHEQNIICSKTSLDGTTHEQTIICWQLSAGHVVSSWPIERTKKNVSNDNEAYLELLDTGFKLHLTPKYFFCLNKSLHLFETHCAFLN